MRLQQTKAFRRQHNASVLQVLSCCPDRRRARLSSYHGARSGFGRSTDQEHTSRWQVPQERRAPVVPLSQLVASNYMVNHSWHNLSSLHAPSLLGQMDTRAWSRHPGLRYRPRVQVRLLRRSLINYRKRRPALFFCGPICRLYKAASLDLLIHPHLPGIPWYMHIFIPCISLLIELPLLTSSICLHAL